MPEAKKDSVLWHDYKDGLRNIIRNANDMRKVHQRLALRWGRTHIILGLPAAILSATAAATGLVSAAGRIPAAIIALFAAGLTAANTFLNSQSQRAREEQIAAEYSALGNDARQLQLATPPDVLNSDHVAAESHSGRQLRSLMDREAELLRGKLPQQLPQQSLPHQDEATASVTDSPDSQF